ncbi:hypothetical protein MKY41_03885 [Sporosarcina sp. FSL W7-1349]|uniref:hypothetical protein n=1 Tax=Sporosarcina sp. FSL W7-1349 TaxID=2921561 RepID=UPI0030FA57CA
MKANGDKILVMETKQTEAQKRMQTNETGNVIDMAHDLLMKQLELTSDSKKPLTVQERKKGMAAYQTGI